MPKHIFLLATFIFVTDCFLCEGQANRAAVKGGTLSTSTSSGGGAGGPDCIISIDTTTFSMLKPGTAAFCLNDVSRHLQGFYDVSTLEPGGDWFYNDPNGTALAGANDGLGISSVDITKPGIYYFKSPGGACLTGIVMTSIIPLDSVPDKTIFCTGGSKTLTAPRSDFSSYQWYNDGGALPGQNANNYVASQTGNYYVQNTYFNNCLLNSDKVNVTVYAPPPQLKVTGDSCINSTLLLDNSVSDLNPETITWYRNGAPIKSFDSKGIVVAGGNGAGSGANQLNQPYGIFLDSMKNIYVADFGNYRIMKWPAGSTSGEMIAGNFNQIAGSPTEVLFDSAYLDIATTSGILQFSPLFNLYKFQFTDVWGLAVNSSHNLYFATEHFVYKVDAMGNAVAVAGNNSSGSGLSQLNSPNGIYLDAMGNLYVADNLTDSLNNYYSRIVKWAPGATSGELIAGGKGHGNAPDQLWFGAGVTFDTSGNMYVSDAVNNRVQLWTPGADHGITIASGFTPWGIKVDGGNIYVADQTNNRVLKYTLLLHNEITADMPGVYKAVVTYPGGCSVSTNDFEIKNCLLPLTLLKFEGQLKNNNTVLTWQTASEHNTSYFNVQRSLDAIHFTTIAKILASGSSSSLHGYSYNDNNVISLSTEKIYYRLNETDIDGYSVQSNIISIDLKKFGWNFTVSPNPVKDLLQVRFNNLYGSTNVALIDMAGRKLTVQQINGSGNNSLNFNTANLAGGLYFIQVINKGRSDYLKFMKE